MKQLFTLVIFLFISSLGFNQGYQPFVVERAHWKMTDGRCDYCGSGINYPQSTFLLWFKLEGDTVINAITYKKLHESLSGTISLIAGQAVPYCTEWTVAGYVREDTAQKKVFIIGNLTGDCGVVSNRDTLFIDFSLTTGDTSRMNMSNPKATLIQTKICMDSAFVADSVSNTGFQSFARRTVHLKPASNINAVGYYIYEGIGPSYGLIGGPKASSNTTYSSSLLQYCVGPDSLCGAGARCGASGINNISADPEIALYPNPANDIVFIETNRPVNLVELFDVAGNCIRHIKSGQTKIELNLSQIPVGIYFCRLYFNDTVVTRKVVVN